MAIQFLSSIEVTGSTSVSSIANDNNAYTGVLVWDGNNLKYRTLSQLKVDLSVDNYDRWFLDGDSGSQDITSGTTVSIYGGTRLNTVLNNNYELTVNHDNISRSNTTSTSTPGYGSNFTVIDSITTGSQGHVTAVNTKTVTLPAAENYTWTAAADTGGNRIILSGNTHDFAGGTNINTQNIGGSSAGTVINLDANIDITSATFGTGVTLSESTDRADLLYINSSTSSWGGLQIGNTSNEFIFSLMGDGTTGGIYDDQNSDWIIQWTENSEVRLYYNASERLNTHSSGVTITGDLTVTGGDIVLNGTGRIQGVDTVSSNTDAANKFYVDNAVGGINVGVTTVQTGNQNLLGVVNPNGPTVTITPNTSAVTSSSSNLATGAQIQTAIDNALTGVLSYQGTWNASTNTPTLTSGSGTPGYYYIVSTAGSTNLDGITDWKVGDWAVFSDLATDAWQKIDNSQVGNVTGSGSSGRIPIWNSASNITSDTGLTFNTSSNLLTVGGQINWSGGSSAESNTAYDNMITGASVTGTTTKTLTLSQQDGGTVTASWTDYNVNYYLTSASFDTGNGILTLNRSGLSAVTVDLDGRYVTSSGVTSVATTNGITGGTITSTGTIQVDSTVVRTSGTQSIAGAKTFTNDVTMANTADLKFVDLAGTFPTSGKGFDWTLNNDGARIYAIQPSSDSIDLTFELRDNTTLNDRFVFFVNDYQGSSFDKYPLIIKGGTVADFVDSSIYTNGVIRLSNSGALTVTSGTFSSDITVNGGDIILGGTGRIQGIDTVSASTDAANKAYVDAHPGTGGTVTSISTTNGITGGTITTSGTLQLDSTVVRTSGAQSISGVKTFTSELKVTQYFNTGTNNVVGGATGIAVGLNNTNNGFYAGTFGIGNSIAVTAEPWNDFGGSHAFGRYNVIAGGYSHANMAVGSDNEIGSSSATVANTLVAGSNNTIFASECLVGGFDNNTPNDPNNYGARGLMFGSGNNNLFGTNSMVGGLESVNFGWNGSMAVGLGVTASTGGQQYAFGTGTTTPTSPTAAYGSNQFVIGQYNVFSTLGRVHLFAVGNGTSVSNRSNVLNVDTTNRVGINNPIPSYELDVTGDIRATGNITAFSDERLKENIKTIDSGLNKLLKLRGVEYNKIGEDKQQIGVIAQEIEEVIPEVVETDDDGIKSVAYGNITAVLIEAIKEQQKQIEILTNKVNELSKG